MVVELFMENFWVAIFLFSTHTIVQQGMMADCHFHVHYSFHFRHSLLLIHCLSSCVKPAQNLSVHTWRRHQLIAAGSRHAKAQFTVSLLNEHASSYFAMSSVWVYPRAALLQQQSLLRPILEDFFSEMLGL